MPNANLLRVRSEASVAVLLKNRRLLIFAVCMVLFQFANASMLPLAGDVLAYAGGRRAAPFVAALIIVPQLIVALFAPWVGRKPKDTDASRCCWLDLPPYQSVRCCLR